MHSWTLRFGVVLGSLLLAGMLVSPAIAQEEEPSEGDLAEIEGFLVGSWAADYSPMIAAAPPEQQASMARVSLTFTFNADHTCTMAGTAPTPDGDRTDSGTWSIAGVEGETVAVQVLGADGTESTMNLTAVSETSVTMATEDGPPMTLNRVQ